MIWQLGVIWHNLLGECSKDIENVKYELILVLVGSLCLVLSVRPWNTSPTNDPNQEKLEENFQSEKRLTNSFRFLILKANGSWSTRQEVSSHVNTTVACGD